MLQKKYLFSQTVERLGVNNEFEFQEKVVGTRLHSFPYLHLEKKKKKSSEKNTLCVGAVMLCKNKSS